MNIDIEKIVDDHMATKRRKQLPFEYVYASGLGQCTRKLYYTYNIPKETDLASLKVFELGNLVHEMVQKVLVEKDLSEFRVTSVRTEVEYPITVFNPDKDELVRIGGRLDGLVVFEDNSKMVLEFKSMSGAKDKITKKETLGFLTKPKDDHMMQIQLYMFSTGAKKGKLVYFTKNTLLMKSFDVDFDYNIFKKAVERAREQTKAMRSGDMPHAEARGDMTMKWQCNFCSWKKECDNNDERKSVENPAE